MDAYMEVNPDLSEQNIRKGIKLVLKDFPLPKARKAGTKFR